VRVEGSNHPGDGALEQSLFCIKGLREVVFEETVDFGESPGLGSLPPVILGSERKRREGQKEKEKYRHAGEIRCPDYIVPILPWGGRGAVNDLLRVV
jgi:hypothetical protein